MISSIYYGSIWYLNKEAIRMEIILEFILIKFFQPQMKELSPRETLKLVQGLLAG